MRRRDFIKYSGLSSLGALLLPSHGIVKPVSRKKPVILVVSGWQDVNIGDIAHTPGLLHLLETYLQGARIILWKKSRSESVGELLAANFPAVKVIYGDVDADKNTGSNDVNEAMKEADIMIHGSGPSLVGADNLACWVKNTGKPFGIFGVTIQDPGDSHLDLLRKAAFIFTRETVSIEHLKKAGITGPHIAFAPDATFFLNIHDDKKAISFLEQNELSFKKFICVVPRLRYTPYHLFRPDRNGWSEERIRLVEETNLKYKEADHAKMREAIITWVRNTGNKVLVCPEMTYQVEIMDELLINPLPADVKPFVLKRGYWLPDEAASVYRRAHTVVSFECHSPIIAAVNSTPVIYLRQPEDTIKGQMYYDLGFSDWVFEIDRSSGSMISARLIEIYKDYPQSLLKLRRSMHIVSKKYDTAFGIIKRTALC